MILIDIEFEKWPAIRASVGGVGGVLAWVAWVACYLGLHVLIIVNVFIEIVPSRKKC